MNELLTDEATRDALHRIVADGADPAKLIEFDFYVDAADLMTTLRVVEVLAAAGFDPHYWQDDPESAEQPGVLRWTVQVSIEVKPQFADVQAIEARLTKLAQSAGGAYDGFGSYGE